MTSFIAGILETIIIAYSIWVLFCVLTQTSNPELTVETFKDNLLLPIQFFKKWGNIVLEKVRTFFKDNM